MIIDCHGHYTTAPESHAAWRREQLRAYETGTRPPAYPEISDAELRATVEGNQLRVSQERGVDVTLFSPRASAMGHHLGDTGVAVAWARACNDLVARVVDLYPERFAAVCQLPQGPGQPLEAAVAELERCVAMGFVGANLNPDPSGGRWTAPPLTDRSWYPLFERMVELEVPAMVHVSASDAPAVHTTGAHYLNADTTVFVQLLEGDLFADLPGLRLVIPHGGGAVPYHWGRFRGLAAMLGRSLDDHLMRNVFLDTCVYHQPGIDLLLNVVGPDNVLFGSEVFGAVRGLDPLTGRPFDDTRRYLEAAGLPDAALERVLAGNARAVYPRLDARLAAPGR